MEAVEPRSAGLVADHLADPQPAVLHVTQPVTEGVGNYVRFLTTHQALLGYRVGLACAPDSELADAARAKGVEVLPFDAGREPSLALGAEVRQLTRAIRSFEPEVVHLHSSKAGAAGRLAVRGRHATVFQPHAWSFEATTGLVGKTALSWERLATRWTDAIITVSEGERALAAPHGIRAQSDATILNPVDTERFRPPVAGEQRPLRATLGLADEPVVLCVGRLCPQKGQDLLLDAWTEVNRQQPNAQLLLAGDGPDRAMLEARRSPNTTFLGEREDMPDVFRVADVVVLPSRWEGMSLAMLEAMASGRPVVSSDVGGAGETVGQGAGAVVSIGDQQQLSAEILHRLRNPLLAEAEGIRGRVVAEQRHSLASTLSAVEQLYERVLRDRSTTRRLRAAPERE